MKGNFQVIVIVIFIALAVVGVLVFSGAIPIGDDARPGSLGKVVLWGTARTATLSGLLEEFNNANETYTLEYVQKSADTFDRELLEALASDRGPDLFFLTDDMVFDYADKIFPIPYQSYPIASFRNTFAGAGEIFLTTDGILALPVSIDPLVMYYNRSTFDTNGIIYPPVTWDEVADLTSTLTQRDHTNKIIKSTVALGHYSNVAHAKQILSTLFMQVGNNIVAEQGGSLRSVLSTPSSKYNLGDILKFYTDFANPSRSVYSWNRSFPNSPDAFSREDTALYFGFASELATLISKNPNQNFAVATIPQAKGTSIKTTGARVTGIALLSSSSNLNTAFLAANTLALGSFAGNYALAQGVAPARRDLLGARPDDPHAPILYDSALFARGWLDPSPQDTEDIFRQMVDGILSNSVAPSEAIRNASSRLNFFLVR